jgi:hypothetical protein
VAREDGLVRVGLDLRVHAQEHSLAVAREPLEAVDVVERVDHHAPHAGIDGGPHVRVVLRVAVEIDASRVRAALKGQEQLAPGGHVAREPLLGEEAVGRGAGERLRREQNLAVPVAALELSPVLTRAAAKVSLVVHVDGRPELATELRHATAADDEVAPVVGAAATRIAGGEGHGGPNYGIEEVTPEGP